MKNRTLYYLILILVSSCGYFGEEIDLFKNADFTKDEKWLLVHDDMDNDKVSLIYDNEILQNLSSDLTIKLSDGCLGTTPDYCISLLRNGKRVESTCYCSWEQFSFDFGRLKDKFVSAERRAVTANSIYRHDFLLDSIKLLENIYLLYPSDTIIEFSGQLRFELKLVDVGQDMFSQEKSIEEGFQNIFNDNEYTINADWYSSESSKPRKLGYQITVDCDTAFLKSFDASKLENNDFFREMSDYRYSSKVFKINYFEWN